MDSGVLLGGFVWYWFGVGGCWVGRFWFGFSCFVTALCCVVWVFDLDLVVMV